MNRRHIENITDPKRRAIAPYNFVELPEQVVTVDPDSLPSGDRYHLNRHTGRIECILTTESPLYTRCGWSPEDFAEYGETPFKDLSDEIQKLRANFFINPATNQPVIPGSSIRGMLRTLVEIVSFSKIDRVSGHQRLFFRAVGSNSNKESWGQKYKQYVKPEIVKAGYLIKNGETWLIQPAVEDKGVTFAWVEESDITNFPDFKYLNDRDYKPQYFNANYDSQFLAQRQIKRKGKIVAEPWFASNIEFTDSDSSSKLVTSGNMKQTDDGNSPRCNHCIVFPQDHKATPLPIDDTAIEHYRNALTEFQKALPFDKDWGVLKEGHPVFYYHDGHSKTVGFFGQSPNFRIPYSPEGNGHATTVLDFIPENLRKLASIDLADAIFGWVKQESESEKLPQDFIKQRAGRVCVTDGLYESNQNGIWYSETPVTPQILSEPKPSYFPHYLVQPKADKSELKHYASKPLEETVIRGHKLYWHKGSNPSFKHPTPDDPKIQSQITKITPINKGVTFKFEINFENLSDVELGALLWILSLSSNKSEPVETGKAGKKYCFSLGMGKPLGMGAVKIDYELHLSDRSSRYSNLFDGNQWKTGEENQAETAKHEKECVKAFEVFMFDPEKGITNKDRERPDKTKATSLKETRRIEMLLAMLRCDKTPSVDQTRYMEIECNPSHKKCISKPKKDGKVNEYADRPVLPNPLYIIGLPDNRRLNNSPSSPSKSAGSGGASGSSGSTSKPILKGQNKGKPIKKSQQPQKQTKPKDNSGGSNSDVLARPPKPKS
ncbi:TIGR03986 family CRISPR-associated RAMP protein [Limnoraphis robusta Tam1]|uniref:TIGR03986 family type III CRISPR-associated RAMP protein n=1 Tax=Limnoraphis robusta TaxID=1118279 RepID=UPI002B205296|nr:TIGR03986 family CRISPR-associated RAMP protein [Limnoraphis robusta]MEA5498944.1 TIGR03986 family CRISPR-associated RAMP protein [Limnoraphis robusta BA-68 BA1]MEA5539454.1 TIGR03986 family CRISPR-associated RAMP protein [Limnoraphis robusta Tam1]